jgi:hypothetical protein
VIHLSDHVGRNPEREIWIAPAFRSETRDVDVEAALATLAEPVAVLNFVKKVEQSSALKEIHTLTVKMLETSTAFLQSKHQAEDVQMVGDTGLKIAKALSQGKYALGKIDSHKQGLLYKAVSELSKTLNLILRFLDYAAKANAKNGSQRMIREIRLVMAPSVQEKGAPQQPGKSSRSELRGMGALIATGVTVKTPQEFFERNRKQGGGHEQGVRGVTEKITDGFYSLLAHSFNALEVAAKLFLPINEATERQTLVSRPESFRAQERFSVAKTALGLKALSVGDVFVIGRRFALEQGAIAAVRTVFGDMPVLVYTDQPEEVQFLEQMNLQLLEARRPPVLVAGDPDEAKKLLDGEAQKLRQAGVSSINFKAMVYEAEALPAALTRQLSDITVVTARMFKNFLNLAGARITALAQEIQGRFALARSA